MIAFPVEGNVVDLTLDCVDARTDEYFDPDTLALTVTPPTGADANYSWPGPPATITQSATGKFVVGYTIGGPGEYTYEWVGTGSIPFHVSGKIFARPL